MSKCVKSSVFGESDVLLRFIESIHIGGHQLQVPAGSEILFNPRNLETLVKSVELDKLNVVATKYEIREDVTASVLAQLDLRLNAFESRIEQLLARKLGQ